MALRYWFAPATSSSAALGCAGLVQKMTMCENMAGFFLGMASGASLEFGGRLGGAADFFREALRSGRRCAKNFRQS